MRLRQIVILAAWLLIAARLFFPVIECSIPQSQYEQRAANCNDSQWILAEMPVKTMMQALGIAAVAAAVLVAGSLRKGGDNR